MKKRWGHASIWATTLPIAALCHFSTDAQAQTARTVYLYNAALGNAQASVNDARTAPWGNGESSNDRRMDFEGAPVLRVTTRNFQEGIRFDLKTPADYDAFRDKGFIRLRVRFRDIGGGGGGRGGMFPGMDGGGGGRGGFGGGGRGGFGGGGRGDFGGGGQDAGGGGGFGGVPAGGGGFGGLLGQFQPTPRWTAQSQVRPLPQFGGGGMPGMGMPGMGMPGMGMPGMGGEDGTGAAAVVPQTTQISEFNLTLIRENGASSGTIPVNLDATPPDDLGWRLLILPIKSLTSTPNASGPIQRVVLTSDKEDSFYLAQAALVIENGQITVSLRRPSDAPGSQVAEIEVKPGPVTLIADVEAGAADPTVEWNFDADNVGNLPPGALSTPPTGMGDGEGGMMPGMTPGMEGMGRPQTGGRPGQGGMMVPGGARMPGMTGAIPGMAGAMPGMAPGGGAATVQVGPRLDARGLTATFEYPNEEQNYRVEVTVRDRSGQKQPVTASILVRVRA
jgi:hypothetical protein